MEEGLRIAEEEEDVFAFDGRTCRLESASSESEPPEGALMGLLAFLNATMSMRLAKCVKTLIVHTNQLKTYVCFLRSSFPENRQVILNLTSHISHLTSHSACQTNYTQRAQMGTAVALAFCRISSIERVMAC
jgi:hypothetical protein